MGAEHRPHLCTEQRLEAEQLGARIDEALRVGGRLGMLDDPLARIALVELTQVLDHALDRSGVRADAAHGGDLGAEGEDRLDLQDGPDHRLGGADPTAAAQVLERVQAEPDVQPLAGAADHLHDLIDRAPLLGQVGRQQHQAAQSPRARLPVMDDDAPRLFLGDEDAGGFPGALACAREPLGQVDREHIAAGLHQRPVDGQEVADRGL